jgi:hypothetical protein
MKSRIATALFALIVIALVAALAREAYAGAPRSDAAHIAGIVISAPAGPANARDKLIVSSHRMRCAPFTTQDPPTASTNFTSRCDMQLDGRLLTVYSTGAIANLGFCAVDYDGVAQICTIGLTLNVNQRYATVDAPPGRDRAWISRLQREFVAENLPNPGWLLGVAGLGFASAAAAVLLVITWLRGVLANRIALALTAVAAGLLAFGASVVALAGPAFGR